MTEFTLAAAARLMFVYLVWIVGMFWVATWRAAKQRREVLLSATTVPRIREALIQYLAGSNDLEPLRRFAGISRNQVGDAIMGFQGTVSGAALDRLCALTLEFHMVDEWEAEGHSSDLIRRRAAYFRLAFLCVYEPCRFIIGNALQAGLDDPDREVRLASARAVLRTGVPAEIDAVFEKTLTQGLLTRALLAEDLRRHASELCARAIPRGLQSMDPQLVLATLDMLLAWERALPLAGIDQLLMKEDRAIRLRALWLAPVVTPEAETHAEVIRALSDPDLEICRAGVRAVARMRLDQAVPLLARLLRQAPPDLAREAASALVELPPLGLLTLQELSASSHGIAAAAANEALAHVRPEAGPR